MIVNLTLIPDRRRVCGICKQKKKGGGGDPTSRARLARGVAGNSWKAGRNNSSTTKENKKGVGIKPSHCILKNTSITFGIFIKRLVLEKWQWFVTRPDPHESGKLKKGGETRPPMSRDTQS